MRTYVHSQDDALKVAAETVLITGKHRRSVSAEKRIEIPHSPREADR
jgi:hypothetical protein